MRAAAALLAGLYLLAAIAAPIGAVHDAGETFVVQLAANGDATPALDREYDLSNATERERFETL